MRTTVDIDAPVLNELKEIQRSEGKSMGRVISDLLALALYTRRSGQTENSRPFRWIARDLEARINLEDKEAIYAALDDSSVNSPDDAA